MLPKGRVAFGRIANTLFRAILALGIFQRIELAPALDASIFLSAAGVTHKLFKLISIIVIKYDNIFRMKKIHMPTYRTWASIKQRCLNPRSTGYYKYGGRGIQICERWKTYQNFLNDMGERPDGLTIDRINNEMHYEPNNCRWATPYQQTHNRRPNHNSIQERPCQTCNIVFKPKLNKTKYCCRKCMATAMVGHSRNGLNNGWRKFRSNAEN